MRAKLLSGPRLLLALIVVAVMVAIVFALRDPPVPVELAEARKGPLVVTIDDLGETRVRNLYVVSAPVTGQLLRVPLKPGDPVVPGSTLLARIVPVEPGPLDPRAFAEAQARIRSLEAQRAASAARTDQVQAELRLAERALARSAELAKRGFVSEANLDRARAARDASRASLAEARASAASTAQSLEAARSALIVAGAGSRGRGPVAVTSPVPGSVLRVPQESARVVAAGTPLVEIGDPAQLELVTDLLSADAVRVQPGAPVLVEQWGGAKPLEGRVRLVEPFGFTKISALGVEEQRVNVVIDFVQPRTAWQRLGHGYRANVRIVIWSGRDLLKVPIGALFRSGGDWSLFVLDGRGRARLVKAKIGRMSDTEAHVRGGLDAGDRVIVHPGDKVRDGVRVRERD